MSNKDNIQNYYNRELAYIRRLGAEFAKANPKVAANLRMSPDAIEDPHVSRLLEGFAFLNARTRQKLDDDFPELTDALLNVLYPHYLAPIPSMAMIQLQPSLSLSAAEVVAKGTMIETAAINGEPCRFQTCYDTTLLPVKVDKADLVNHRHQAPVVSNKLGVAGVLHIELSCVDKQQTFAELAPEQLRFFLKGQSQQMFTLYDLIMNHSLRIAIANKPDDKDPVFLDIEHLRAVGFDDGEGLLPYSPRSFLGYRLLTEFFTFPEKFLFIELADLKNKLANIGNKLHIYFYLNQSNKELEQHIDKDNFALGCTPMINLFKHRAEPINVDHTETEYHVVANVHRPQAYEIYSINAVTEVKNNGKQQSYEPFYGISHRQQQKHFWYAARRPAPIKEGESDQGTEMYLSLVDLDMEPSQLQRCVIDVETISSNRDLPSKLPFGGGQPYLQFSEGAASVAKIICLTPPTPTHRASMGRGAQWRLISHLSLNHLSLTNDKDSVAAIREMLRLYDYTDTSDTRLMIEGLLKVTSKRTLVRDPSGGLSGFCQGMDITIELDEHRFSGGSAYLFAAVLERFFALYCSINSFTKLTAMSKGKRKVIHSWPARAGEQQLI